MICTAPCIPRCTAEATFVLKTKSGTVYGHNCGEHIPKASAKDYVIEPIPVEADLQANWTLHRCDNGTYDAKRKDSEELRYDYENLGNGKDEASAWAALRKELTPS